MQQQQPYQQAAYPVLPQQQQQPVYVQSQNQYGQPVIYQQPMYQQQPVYMQPAPVTVVVPQQQQQQVVQTQPAFAASAQDAPLLEKPEDKSQRFQGDQCRDPFWAALFVIQFIALLGLAIYFYAQVKNEESGTFTIRLTGKQAGIIVLFLVQGLLLSWAWLEIMKRNAKNLIWLTLGLGIALYIILGIACIAADVVAGAIVCFVFAGIHALYAFLVRKRVPFAATMLTIVTECVQLYSATIWVALGSMLVQAIWVVIWVMGVAAIYHNIDENELSDGSRGGIVFLLLVSFYWCMLVVKNVVHVTVGGTFATWYFFAPQMPDNPTWRSFKRAMCPSFGSICLGSLVIAVVKALRTMAEQGRRAKNGFARCIAVCLLRCLDQLIQFFNQYAFAQVAIYGKTYCEAAKSTWNLLKSRGFDLLINDNIIGSVLMLGVLLIGIVSGCISILLSKYVFTLDYWGAWAAGGFFVGFAMAICAVEVVDSCVCVCFVCFAEDPEALQRTKPKTHEALTTSFTGRLNDLRGIQAQEANH